ncbi:unnamed protein product [Didymodactylos carnosus]|uniref:ATP-dependent DNA helicase n=1 Tax=Didymodactylos carnosus TaxID=1234261 RepID=A0A815FKQ6_9BILA|nr:unnamed protein product [Didymodactylos carnosus]CAF1324792.1 unnamed protein product [Didymodactylos carnosus]CAF4092467.1 unnamed protein product [Didymodactylos carnosus]CAF4173693.1 unnamed protein product [Didymodactylos carnosus]
MVRTIAENHSEPIRLFTTGGAGTGKIHLLKRIYHEASKVFSNTNGENLEEIHTLICAPTNAGAFNTNSDTIHATFMIGEQMYSISENQINTLRFKLDGLMIVFINEISLIDQSLWKEFHARLAQIMSTSGACIHFRNISIVAVGDFYQLPPVFGLPHYVRNNIIDYWTDLFEYFELTIC